MANNDYNIAPVDHGVLSATGSVGVGTAGGAAKAFGKTMLWVVAGAATLGFLYFGGFFAAAGTLLGGFTTAYPTVGALWTAAVGQTGVLGGVLGAIGMAIPGLAAGAFTGAFSGLYGAGKGALEASQRVSQEKGLAKSMQMQMAAYQSMAASNDNKYNFPPQGSAMNPASTRIMAEEAQGLGTLQSQQRALA